MWIGQRRDIALKHQRETHKAAEMAKNAAQELAKTTGHPSSIREYVRLRNFQNGRHYKGFVWEFR